MESQAFHNSIAELEIETQNCMPEGHAKLFGIN
jgi:hypothetical protein